MEYFSVQVLVHNEVPAHLRIISLFVEEFDKIKTPRSVYRLVLYMQLEDFHTACSTSFLLLCTMLTAEMSTSENSIQKCHDARQSGCDINRITL